MPNECKYKKNLSDSLFCRTADYYCTVEQESTCKEKSITAHEMTAAEAADFLDGLADGYETDMQGKSDYHSEWIKKLRYSASILCRVASGELAPVIHAHWIVNTDDFTPKKRCSACGYNKPIIAGENVGQEPDTHCPSCGALMDGKEDNHE